jgi:uncharacterized protein (DUF169 family)
VVEDRVTDYREIEQRISRTARLAHRPVAVAFLDTPPANVEAFGGREPSGCSFWRLAEGGRTFSTVPSDHFNCAVGSYTHNIDLSPDRSGETMQTLGMMFNVGYIRPEEVAGIPRLPSTPQAIVYSPLADSPVAPSVVVFRCRPASAMLLQEAATRAGKAGSLPPLGRPTCMALPAALAHGTTTSLGCIGNRVYTGLGEDELYVAVPEGDLRAVADALDVIANANAELASYARGRRDALSSE